MNLHTLLSMYVAIYISKGASNIFCINNGINLLKDISCNSYFNMCCITKYIYIIYI